MAKKTDDEMFAELARKADELAAKEADLAQREATVKALLATVPGAAPKPGTLKEPTRFVCKVKHYRAGKTYEAGEVIVMPAGSTPGLQMVPYVEPIAFVAPPVPVDSGRPSDKEI